MAHAGRDPATGDTPHRLTSQTESDVRRERRKSAKRSLRRAARRPAVPRSDAGGARRPEGPASRSGFIPKAVAVPRRWIPASAPLTTRCATAQPTKKRRSRRVVTRDRTTARVATATARRTGDADGEDANSLFSSSGIARGGRRAATRQMPQIKTQTVITGCPRTSPFGKSHTPTTLHDDSTVAAAGGHIRHIHAAVRAQRGVHRCIFLRCYCNRCLQTSASMAACVPPHPTATRVFVCVLSSLRCLCRQPTHSHHTPWSVVARALHSRAASRRRVSRIASACPTHVQRTPRAPSPASGGVGPRHSEPVRQHSVHCAPPPAHQAATYRNVHASGVLPLSPSAMPAPYSRPLQAEACHSQPLQPPLRSTRGGGALP